jgi:hypothetical protein
MRQREFVIDEMEGPVGAISRTQVLRAVGGRTAEACEDRSNITDIVLKCLNKRFVFRLRRQRRRQGSERGYQAGAKLDDRMRSVTSRGEVAHLNRGIPRPMAVRQHDTASRFLHPQRDPLLAPRRLLVCGRIRPRHAQRARLQGA